MLAQTFEDWEIVVADDGSTDGTLALASSFGDHVEVVRSPGNAGPASARNLAIARSGGELLAFLDADDLWLPGFLERQVRRFDEAQELGLRIGIVACNARLLGADGFLTGTYQDRFGFPDDVTLARLLESNPIYVSALVPRPVFDEVGGFCPEIFGAEDFDLWVRIVERGYRVVATKEPLAVHRVTEGSVSARADSMARAVELVYRRALDRRALGPRERRIAERELRLRLAVGAIMTPTGLSYGRAMRTLPQLIRVLGEHPRRWPSYARMLARRATR